jgi:4-diphosphocytidyl-2-C-methyl-D-erythritol kinase
MAPLSSRAPAKVNLMLRVGARRADGLHELESLVVFADIVDELSLDAERPRAIEVVGPLRAACGPAADNLVLKAAASLSARLFDLKLGHFTLLKRIPVAAGLGGGSADAAAALRLLAQANALSLADHRLQDAARATGADVPVCLDPRPRFMRGVGEKLSSPLQLPPLPAVLVNPRIALPTAEVFAAFDAAPPPAPAASAAPAAFAGREDLFAFLRAQPNDLEGAAMALQPAVGEVLQALRALPACRLARMSGSGATCFGLFETPDAAAGAARRLRQARPEWWIEETMLGE